jgi:hypothetical protein
VTTLRQIAEKYGAIPKQNKYGNKREAGFDSRLEMRGFGELEIRQRAGEISELKLHPRFPIVWPGQDEPFTTVEMDASFIEQGALHVIDWKGNDTALSRLKRKLLKAAYGIDAEIIKKVRR